MAFSQDGTTLAAGDQDGMTQLWNLDADAAIRRIWPTTSKVLTAAVWSQDLSHLGCTAPCAHPGHHGLISP